jgi:squalene-hopene/tetraprenyl-beta-curcumene cyclase
VCISCHTALTYLLARDALPPPNHGSAESEPPAELQLLSSVAKRVQLGGTLPPYYPKQAIAARATEAVLNALILAHHDAVSGQLSPLTRRALMQLWALQITSGSQAGSWPWINFRNEPWEALDSPFVGAAFAALAIGYTPLDYRADPAVQQGLHRLQSYFEATYGQEPLLNRIDLLWASGHLPQLLAPAAKQQLISQILRDQHADGGWNTASLMPNWKRRDNSIEPTASDAYATGLVALALQEAGVPGGDPQLRRAIEWLERHQHLWSGGWSAHSLNRRYENGDFTGGFMDDSATAYAVLALTDTKSDDTLPDCHACPAALTGNAQAPTGR